MSLLSSFLNQSVQWCSLYVPTTSRKTVRTALDEVYQGAGYVSYNPFAGGTGTPQGAKQLIRLFVSPKSEGWIRILGEPDYELSQQLAEVLVLPIWLVWVGETEGGVIPFGEASPELTASLRRSDSILPLETASENPLEDFAEQQGVNFASADKLIQKTTRSLFQKMGGADQQEDAAQLIPNAFSWQNPIAQEVLKKVVEMRLLPPNWHQPSFGDLAAAYQIAAMLDKNPNTPLLSSEDALLDKVAYPLDYKPAYFSLSV